MKKFFQDFSPDMVILYDILFIQDCLMEMKGMETSPFFREQNLSLLSFYELFFFLDVR